MPSWSETCVHRTRSNSILETLRIIFELFFVVYRVFSMSDQLNTKQSTRRTFLLNATSSLTTLAVANSVVYAVGAAFKDLDGSLVAGAKTCECTTYQYNEAGCGGGIISSGTYSFSVSTESECWAFDGTCRGKIGYELCNIR